MRPAIMPTAPLCGALTIAAITLAALPAALLATPKAAAGEPCTPHWAEGTYCRQGFDFGGQVSSGNAMAVYDDGTGPALYIGGNFFNAGCFTDVGNIVKWDGVRFTPLVGDFGLMGVAGGGASAQVNAMAVFDDGSGPALYIGGSFTSAGGVPAINIVRWDGVAFSKVGGFPNSPPNITGPVLAMCVSPDGGSLVVGGGFTGIGGADGPTNRIARWNGSEWLAFQSGPQSDMNAAVHALGTFNDGTGNALYAAGEFTTAGGVTVNRVAKWANGSWSPLEGPSAIGVDAIGRSLATYDDGNGTALYVGGNFTTAGGVTVNKIARWDGTTWSALSGPGGVGVVGNVHALKTYNDGHGPALYVAGAFFTAGGITVNHFGRWDGTNWSAATGPWSSGVGVGNIFAMVLHDDGTGAGPAIYATGTFTTAGGLYAARSARWNGNEWSVLVSPEVSGPTNPSVTVATLFVHDDGAGESLLIGGGFTDAAGVLVNRITRWQGADYAPLNGSTVPGVGSGVVQTIAAFDDGNGPAIYAGGTFTTADGATANRIAKWNGSTWSPLVGPSGNGLNSLVWSSAVFDDGSGPALYVGGQFATAGGVTVNRIAKWNGSAWSALDGPGGVGLNAGMGTIVAYAMTTFDDGTGPALYVGGHFTQAGGVTVNHIAKWDGSAWSPLATLNSVGVDPTATNTAIRAMAVHDDGNGPALYVAGNFVTIGGTTFNAIARWDGTTWSTLESNGAVGVSGPGASFLTVFALCVHDPGDGSGPGLYAGGSFLTAGGQTVNRMARWDGTAWSALEGPLATGIGMGGETGVVLALASYDDGSGDGHSLFAGGDFVSAGGIQSRFLAKWRGCGGASPSIPGDLNGDGVVNGADLGVLLTNWGPCPPPRQGPAPCPGDLNGDGVVDGADLGILLSNWG